VQGVVDPAVPGKLGIKSVELRDPDRDEVAVRVTAISLDRARACEAVLARSLTEVKRHSDAE
jgi:hypothetical protein